MNLSILIWTCISIAIIIFLIAVDGRDHHRKIHRFIDIESEKHQNIAQPGSIRSSEERAEKRGKTDGGGSKAVKTAQDLITSEAKPAVDALAEEIKKTNFKEFTEAGTKGAKVGVDATLTSAEAIYDSIKKRDKIGTVISVISLLSGVAVATGGPIGNIVAMSLNLMKLGLNIYRKESAGPVESEAQKMEKMIKTSLNEFRESGLRAEWSGYERLADLFLKNVELAKEFHLTPLTKISKADKEYGLNDQDKLNIAKQKMFEAVVPRMYDVLMESNKLIGKVEYEISQACDYELKVESVIRLKYAKANRDGETTRLVEEEKEKKNLEFADRCLGMYELYAKINYFRGVTYLDNLKQLNDIMRPNGDDILKVKPEMIKDLTPKAKLFGYIYIKLILNVIQNSNQNNMQIFYPFRNPFNFYKMRYAVNYYYTYTKKYEFMDKYIQKLDYSSVQEQMSVLKDVMFCDKSALTGSCYTVEAKGIKVLNFPTQDSKIRSVFVPPGKKILFTYKNSDSKILLFGPGVMGGTFNLLKKDFGKPVEDPIIKISITNFFEEKQKVNNFAKLCVAPGDYVAGPLPYHRSVCTMIELTDKQVNAGKIKKITGFKTRTSWQGNYLGLASDEEDLAFVGTAEFKINKKNQLIRSPDVSPEEKGLSTMKIRWGPFFGPREMSKLCGSALWDDITIYRYQNSEERKVPKRVVPKDDPRWCEDNLLCKDDVINKELFVKICKEPNMEGYCEEIPYGKSMGTKIVDLTRINVHIDIDGKDVTDDDLSQYKVMLDENKEADGEDSDVSKKGRYNEKIDECIWTPRLRKKSVFKFSENEWKNLLQSMVVPKGVTVTLHTMKRGLGFVSYGPYVGPVTVQRVDGNIVDSSVLKSLVISLTNGQLTTAKNNQATSEATSSSRSITIDEATINDFFS